MIDAVRCEDCRVWVPGGLAAYIQHSLSEHGGAGWRPIATTPDRSAEPNGG